MEASSSMWRLRTAFTQSSCSISIQKSSSCSIFVSAQHLQTEPRYTPPQSWSGLEPWRSSGVNEMRAWGPKKNPIAVSPPSTTTATTTHSHHSSLADYARQVLLCADPLQKAELAHHAWRTYLDGNLPIGTATAPPSPARPSKPELLPPRRVPTIKQTTLPLNAYTLHNLAHVELNAIDLACDTIVRFSHLRLPAAFYTDFARIADDEGRHLRWCLQRLEEIGCEYGCVPSHSLLWDGCAASAGDISARLAIVPMSQEARGLDSGARLADRLVGWGDNRSAAIVARIAEEEKAHVAVGVSWFSAICAAQGVEPGAAFAAALTEMCPDLLRGGSFHHAAREEVGLLREWYDVQRWDEERQGRAEVALQRTKEADKKAFADNYVNERVGLKQASVDRIERGGDDDDDVKALGRRLENLLAAELDMATV